MRFFKRIVAIVCRARALSALLIVCAVAPVALCAGNPLEDKWRWAHFSIYSGLPSNIVRDIMDAPDGTPWALTAEGLAWFDGFQWHKVQSSIVQYRNSLGGIRGFVNHGIVIQINSQFYFATKEHIALFPVDSITTLWVLNNDSVLVVRNRAYYVYAHGALWPYPLPEWRDGVSHTGRMITNFHVVETPYALFAWDGNDRHPILDFEQGPTGVQCLAENAMYQGVAVVGYPTSQAGVWVWKCGERAQRVAFSTIRRGLFSAIADNGDIAILYENNLVRCRRDGKWSTLSDLPDFLRDVSSLRYRRNGDLWVATDHGLFLCRISAAPWVTHSWDDADLRNRVNNILRARDGTTWLATSGGLVHRVSRGATSTVTSILGTRIAVVTGLAEDHDGNIWISSGSEFPGAYRWDGARWRHYPVLYRGAGVYVHKIECDSKGRLWFLGLSKGWDASPRENAGVFVLNNGEVIPWMQSSKLPHPRAYAFAEGNDGAQWFGTLGGLSRYRNNEWTTWRAHGGPIMGSVTTVAVDRRNRVWFGMQNEGAGVGMLDSAGAVHYFTTQDGLPDDFVWDVKVDAAQRVWATTTKGLACYDQDKWLVYDERTGLSDAMLWPVSPGDSVVYVGSITNGWAELRLAQSTEDNPRIAIHAPVIEDNQAAVAWDAYTAWGTVPPEKVLTRYRISGQPWSTWTATHMLTFTGLRPGEYTLEVQAKGLYGQYGTEGATMAFSVMPPLFERWYVYCPSLAVAGVMCSLVVMLYRRRKKYVEDLGQSELRYRTITQLMSDYAYLYAVLPDHTLKLLWMTDAFERISGYTSDEADHTDFIRRFVHPDDLEKSMGAHRALLRGEQLQLEHRVVTKGGDVRWVERRASPVKNDDDRVEYIYGVVHDITERKEREQRLRALAGDLVTTEERERRRMATFLHDVIGQSLTLTYLKLHRWQMKQCPDDNALEEIRGNLDQIIQDAHTLTFELSPPIIYELSVGEALDWLVRRLGAQYHIAFVTDFPTEPVFVGQELHVLLFQAVRELLVNSLKHAHAQTVQVGLSCDGGRIQITVNDDGVGFEPSTLIANAERNGGFGLFNIRDRLSDFDADVAVDSSPGHGTRITISAPVGERPVRSSQADTL